MRLHYHEMDFLAADVAHMLVASTKQYGKTCRRMSVYVS